MVSAGAVSCARRSPIGPVAGSRAVSRPNESELTRIVQRTRGAQQASMGGAGKTELPSQPDEPEARRIGRLFAPRGVRRTPGVPGVGPFVARRRRGLAEGGRLHLLQHLVAHLRRQHAASRA
jgi:hypothetical protein